MDIGENEALLEEEEEEEEEQNDEEATLDEDRRLCRARAMASRAKRSMRRILCAEGMCCFLKSRRRARRRRAMDGMDRTTEEQEEEEEEEEERHMQAESRSATARYDEKPMILPEAKPIGSYPMSDLESATEWRGAAWRVIHRAMERAGMHADAHAAHQFWKPRRRR